MRTEQHFDEAERYYGAGTPAQVAQAKEIIETAIAQVQPIMPRIIERMEQDIEARRARGRDISWERTRLEAARNLPAGARAIRPAPLILDHRLLFWLAPRQDFLPGRALPEDYKDGRYEIERERLAERLIDATLGLGLYWPVPDLRN